MSQQIKVPITKAKSELSDMLLGSRRIPLINIRWRIPFIHGVGTGVKVAGKSNLRVYVSDIFSKRVVAMVAWTARSVGALVGIPFNFRSFPIDLVAAPRARLSDGGATPDFPPHFAGCPYNSQAPSSLVPAGVSVWRWEASSEVGTIGYFCQNVPPPPGSTDPPLDTSSAAERYLLSCNHVLVPPARNYDDEDGNKNVTRHGEESPPGQQISMGQLAEFVHLDETSEKNLVDAAIMKMNRPAKADARLLKLPLGPGMDFESIKISGYDRFEEIEPCWKVSKHGYASCWTDGEIDDPDCDFVMKHAGYEVRFVNQVRIVRFNPVTNEVIKFATGGDSGSLVIRSVEQEGSPTVYRAVGLLYAVGYHPLLDKLKLTPPIFNGTSYALANPIDVVLAKLNEERAKTGQREITLVTDPV